MANLLPGCISIDKKTDVFMIQESLKITEGKQRDDWRQSYPS